MYKCNGSCTKSLLIAQKRLYLYPNLYTVVLILVIHYMNKTTSLLQYCTTIRPRLPAEVIYSILQYTTIHHGYQPKLSTVYYSILQYTTATSRSYLQYSIILQYTTIHHGYQPKLSIVYYSIYYNTPRLPAEVIYSILQYTTIHHGYQPKLSIVYYSILQYTTATSRSYL